MTKRVNLYDSKIYEEKVNKENKLLLNDYILELKSKGRSEKTIYQYSSDIRAFYCWLYNEMDNAYILDLKKRSFRKFFLMLQENGTSSARINRFQSSVRNMLEFASEDDDEYDYKINAMRSIKGVQGEKVRDIVFLTDEQIDIILNRLLKEEKFQMALYLSLSYDSAARRNEVLQVEKEGFTRSNKTNIVVGKRGKKFPLLYFRRTREIARKYLVERNEDDIPSMWVAGEGKYRRARSYESLYIWVLYFRQILLEETGEDIKINPHSFRHSALTNYENGTHHTLKELGRDHLPIEVLKVLANHESIDTTQSYLPNKDDELLAEAFNLL